MKFAEAWLTRGASWTLSLSLSAYFTPSFLKNPLRRKKALFMPTHRLVVTSSSSSSRRKEGENFPLMLLSALSKTRLPLCAPFLRYHYVISIHALVFLIFVVVFVIVQRRVRSESTTSIPGSRNADIPRSRRFPKLNFTPGDDVIGRPRQAKPSSRCPRHVWFGTCSLVSRSVMTTCRRNVCGIRLPVSLFHFSIIIRVIGCLWSVAQNIRQFFFHFYCHKIIILVCYCHLLGLSSVLKSHLK